MSYTIIYTESETMWKLQHCVTLCPALGVWGTTGEHGLWCCLHWQAGKGAQTPPGPPSL